MPDIIVSPDIDKFLKSSNNTEAVNELGFSGPNTVANAAARKGISDGVVGVTQVIQEDLTGILWVLVSSDVTEDSSWIGQPYTLDPNGQIIINLEIADVAGTIPDVGVLGRVGNKLTLGDGVTEGGEEIGEIPDVLTDSSDNPSIDIVDRQLLHADGSVAAQWVNGSNGYLETNGLYGIGGSIGIEVASGYLADGGIPTLDWMNRELLANDGTSVSIGWADPTPVFAYGATLAPTAVSYLAGGEGTISYVNDADSPTVGSAVVGGGSDKCLVCYNGTNHIVTALL